MIVFENKGALDIRAIKTFGVSSKEDKSTAIGYFGTGLKYAIAILLRNNHKVTVITDNKRYEFDTVRSTIRNDTFDIVTMNGEELGFTTELGKDWELWMAFRELYSNALDEHGKVYRSDLTAHDANNTYVMVEGFDFEGVFDKRHLYFLREANRCLVEHNDKIEVYIKSRIAEATIFYKGIAASNTKVPALYDYNFLAGVTLSEDRTIKSQWDVTWNIPSVVLSSQNKDFITKMVQAPDLSFEGGLNFGHGIPGNIDTFLDVVGDLRKKFKDTQINHTAIEMHKKHRKVTTTMPGISCHLTTVEQQQFTKAVNFCKDVLSLDLDEFELIVAKDLGGMNHLGRADIENGKMYISKRCFQEGTKRVAVAILEEYTHCKHRVYDETPEQKWIYLNQIVSLGEEIHGEPL
jgi:hypothetical protein